MKSLFVATAVNYGVIGTVGGVWEADSIPVGSLSIFAESGINGATGSAGSVTAVLNGTFVSINSMTADGNMQSIKMERKGFTYNKKVYVAPVKAVKFLGSNILTATTAEKGNLNLPSTLSVGDIVGVSLIDKSKNET